MQHQNLDETINSDEFVLFGRTRCCLSTHLPPNDAADAWVYSFPGAGDSLRVEFTFSDPTINPKIAGIILDLLCDLMGNIGERKLEAPRQNDTVLLPIKAPTLAEGDGDWTESLLRPNWGESRPKGLGR